MVHYFVVRSEMKKIYIYIGCWIDVRDGFHLLYASRTYAIKGPYNFLSLLALNNNFNILLPRCSANHLYKYIKKVSHWFATSFKFSEPPLPNFQLYLTASNYRNVPCVAKMRHKTESIGHPVRTELTIQY